MNRLVIESALLVDALSYATRVAPERGDNFEKHQGILVEQVNPTQILITALDGDNTWQRWADHHESEGKVAWRLSSLVAKFLMQLPISDGQLCEIADGDIGRITVRTGSTVGQFAVLDAEAFPRVHVDVHHEALLTVIGLTPKLKQVAFAVDDDKASALSGIHFDGKQMIACNRYVAARVPCEIPLPEPLTAPLGAIMSSIRRAEEIQMGAHGKRLVLMPDLDTVITSTILEGAYPDTARLWKMTEPCTQQVEFDASEALSVLNRILVLCRTDQFPTCTTTFTEGAMLFELNVPDVGHVTDEVPCTTIMESSFTMKFNPRSLRDAFAAAAGTVQLFYQRDAMRPVRIDGAHDFSAVLMPMNPRTK